MLKRDGWYKKIKGDLAISGEPIKVPFQPGIDTKMAPEKIFVKLE